MRHLFCLLVLIGVTTLCACTSTIPENNANAPEISTAEVYSHQEYLERIDTVAVQLRGICAASINQCYFKKTPCVPVSMTDAQLTDRSHITNAQKTAAIRIFKRQRDLNAKTRQIMIDSGDPHMIELAIFSESHVMPKIEKLQDAFLSGTITWGEYNRGRLTLFEESRNKTPH